jgi:hypothetical protein
MLPSSQAFRSVTIHDLSQILPEERLDMRLNVSFCCSDGLFDRYNWLSNTIWSGSCFGTTNDLQASERVRSRTQRQLKRQRSRVFDKLYLYAATVTKSFVGLQVQGLQKKKSEVLEWIWPESNAVLTPKSSDQVGESCQWFLKSEPYQNWICQGPSVLVDGKRILLPLRED